MCKENWITLYLIDVVNETAKPVTIPNALNSFYAMLNCELVAMPTHKIGVRNGRQYVIIADDEALFKTDPKISAIDNLGRPMLVGNILIAKNGTDGELASLADDDIQYINRFVQLQATHKYSAPYPMLHQCEYA